MIEEAENHAAILPEQSSRRAWGKACGRFENVVLSADLQFAEKGDGPIFKFSLNPLKLEASHRLARKFGGDRICVVGVPGIERLPPYLKMDASVIRDGLIKLLIDTDISFLGRKWRAFNMKSDSSKRNQRDKPASVNDIKFHIYLFARDGDGFRDRTQTGELEPQDHHVRMEVQDLLEWFMPFKINQNQSALKFFARLALGSIIKFAHIKSMLIGSRRKQNNPNYSIQQFGSHQNQGCTCRCSLRPAIGAAGSCRRGTS